jgi:hypothetical protein
MNAQIEPLLAAAAVPATIVNWCGDEVVTAEDWCAYLAELTGSSPNYTRAEYPGSIRGSAGDAARRNTITGPCALSWRDGMRAMFEARYPNGAAGAELPASAARLLNSVRRD